MFHNVSKNNVLRILIVAHSHPALGPGGAQGAAHALFRCFNVQPGVTATFLAADDDNILAPDQPAIAPFRGRCNEFLLRIAGFDPFLLSQPSEAIQTAFEAFIKDLKPDVIHFHHYLNVGVELISAARRARPDVRVVATLHEYLAICHHHGLMVRTKSHALCRAAGDEHCATCFETLSPARFARRRHHLQQHFAAVDLFIAPSAFLRNRYDDWGIAASRIIVLDNGTTMPQPAPKETRSGGSKTAFAYFGQVHPFKGIDCLIEAFDRLALFSSPDDPDAHLIIHGAHLEANHPDYVAAFRRSLDRHSGRITFAGPYAPADLPQLMAAIDWVIVPSTWWENSPMIIQEALACRRPVICSGIGGMREKVRQGLDGFHFPVGDAFALAVLMRQISADGRIWDRLQTTMQTPPTIADCAIRHIELYASIGGR